MRNIADQIFGVVLVNKFIIAMANGKPLAKMAKLFAENYMKLFKEGSEGMKAYLLLAPIVNMFLFAGFFSFVFIALSDLYLLRKVLNK